MRFQAGLPSDEFESTIGWQALREPAVQNIARETRVLSFALLCVVAISWYLLGVSPLRFFRVEGGILGLLALLISFVLLIIFHELIHASIHPNFGASRDSVLGASLRPFMFYACYQGSLPRNRFIAILLAPFIGLTVVPLVAHAVGLFGESIVGTVALLSTLNAAMACVDIFGVYLLLQQVPRNAQVRNKGWLTYWQRKAT